LQLLERAGKNVENYWSKFYVTERIITSKAWLIALTEFGDIAVLIPLAAVLFLWLVLTHSPRGAAGWVMAVVLCVGP
jgi:hypothetical protein